MKNISMLKHHGKTMLILAVCLCIPFISIWYIASYINENIFYEQKKESLMAMTRVLESHLVSGGYDEILTNAGMKDASREEQIAALNEVLSGFTDEVAGASEGLGVGYYSRELDAILTYGPSAEYQRTVGVSIGEDHPGRQVMATGIAQVTMGSMVRGNIMNAMLPVVRGGEVIGYIWANNLVSELEQTLSQMSSIILVLLVFSYIVMLIIIIIFIRRIIKSDQKRDKILSVMNSIATLLLAETNEEHFEESLLDGMEIIGQSMNADCVQIWQNEARDDGLYFALKYKWLSDEGRGAPPVDIGTAIPYSRRWKELFLRGENINGPVARLPQEDQDLLSPLGLLSTVIIPLYYQDSFWGVFCVDDVIEERYFTRNEVDMLRSATLMLVNAINRNLIQRKLKTTLEKMEDVLEQNELQITKLDMAIQASKVGLWEMEVVKYDPVNPNNVFIWSDELREMLGYENESDFPNILSSWSDLLHPEDKEKTLDAFAAHLLDTTGKTPYNVEYRLLKKDGEYSYYHAAGVTVREKSGEPVRVVGTLVDITETKIIILDSERQRIQAEAANKAKSNFLSTMSHEIRTPMNAIIGMTAIGKLTNDARKKNDALNKIESASKHLLGIISDVLDMSKIEADKFELSPVSFDFEKMLQKIAEVINLRIDERRQKFFIQIDKDIPQTLIGDDQRLAQVITNLLSNASKFTPEEGVIRLDSRFISEENGVCRLQISVEDTGIGITDEQKARLFVSFEQAEATTTRRYGGTGLGLAIARRIVELMGGEIWVESEPGKGSKFIFTFLIKRGVEVERYLLNDGVTWENIRIFVVDDEVENREFFTVVAEDLGISCTVAASGEEATGMLEKNDNYDIYFIDWMLPGMNGIELARHIQARATGNPIVTIFSSVDWNVIEEEARAAGIVKFLPKPLFPSVIVDVINTCINIIAEEGADDGLLHTDDFSGYRVLLADDVDINREILLSLLEPTGLNIDCVENGMQALKTFAKTPDKYNMVFMDIQMPEMDGYEATRQIRALGALQAKTVPIIAMTANVFREDIEKSLEAGMNGHIGKPIDISEVMKVMRQYLR